MSLSKEKVKPFYTSKDNDVLEEFYIPCLSKSKIYKRVSAYFDSNILKLYSKGIESILNNDGHIYFIFSSQINKNDFELIKDGYILRTEVTNDLLTKISDLEDSSDISNLAYLISINKVDIKIAFTKNYGIFHDKFGLIENGNDIVYFRGSNNETVASIKSNYESFETSCSWNADRNEYIKIKNAKDTFDKLWEDKHDDIVVVDIPQVVKDKLIEYSKDRIITMYEEKNNCFILDYVEDKLLGINKLEKPDLINPQYSFYKMNMQHLVFKTDDNKFIFNENIDYVVIKKFINKLIDYSCKASFNVFITPMLNRFLNSMDILIDKRQRLGVAIKQKDLIILPEYQKFKKIVDEELVRTLREPQMWDAFHIATMMRSANFSVPGAGKTSIVLGAYGYLSSNDINEVDQLLVIGPVNSFLAWKNEFKLCFGNKRELKLFDYQEQKRNGKTDKYHQISYSAKEANLILFNYESIQNNIDALTNLITKRTMIVFDEVHRIKAVSGIRAKYSKKISSVSKYRVVMTGTPVPNGYIDLYNMLNILFSEEYNSFFGFDEKTLKNADSNIRLQEKINNKIYPFFCRTTKDELNVPKANEDNLELGYTIANDKEKELIEMIYKIYNNNPLLLYIRLIQASNNPRLLLKNVTLKDLKLFDTEDYTNEFSSKKIVNNQLTIDQKNFISNFDMTTKFYRGIDIIIELINNGPIVIWGIFIDTLEKIKVELNKRGVVSEVITGSVDINLREEKIIDFLNGKYKVLITNPHTLGESISLHSICHQAIYFEYSFNLVHMLQSRDRIHRLGLNKNQETNYYYLTLNTNNSLFDAIDMKIYNRLKEKELLQEDVVKQKVIKINVEDVKDDIKAIFNKI